MSCPISGHESVMYPELEHRSFWLLAWWCGQKWIMYSIIKGLITEMISKFFLDRTNIMYMGKKLYITWFSNNVLPPILFQYAGEKRILHSKASYTFSVHPFSPSRNSATIFELYNVWTVFQNSATLFESSFSSRFTDQRKRF